MYSRHHSRRATRFTLILAAAATLLALGGCTSGQDSPKSLLERFFSSAVKQDYAATYACYYAQYQAKISKDDFVKHRNEASVLKGYKILALNQQGDTAQADVQLTFAPSKKLNRTEPAVVRVNEEMVREPGGWRIKVW